MPITKKISNRLKFAYIRIRTRLRYGRRVKLGKWVRLERSATIKVGKKPSEHVSIGRGCHIHQGVIIATYGGSVEIGEGCSINPYSVIYGHGGLIIGKGCQIAAHVVCIPANHIFDDPQTPIAKQGETREGITIKDDVWIGTRATILDGVTIGKGSVVAAGAVVTKDVPAMTVVAGVPARQISTRNLSP